MFQCGDFENAVAVIDTYFIIPLITSLSAPEVCVWWLFLTRRVSVSHLRVQRALRDLQRGGGLTAPPLPRPQHTCRGEAAVYRPCPLGPCISLADTHFLIPAACVGFLLIFQKQKMSIRSRFELTSQWAGVSREAENESLYLINFKTFFKAS